MEETRRCSKCGETKPREGFYEQRGCRDGLRPDCKACRSSAERTRRAANPERQAASRRAWRAANQEHVAAARRSWATANQERVAATNRAWRAANPKRAAANGRAWQAANQERVAVLGRRSLLRRYGLTIEGYDEMLAAQGGGCAICGVEPDGEPGAPRFPVDHDHSCCPGKRTCGQCVRGILCSPCNRLLGRFERYRDAFIAYTEKGEGGR